MFTRCPICGKKLFTLFSRASTCPKCGGALCGADGPTVPKKGADLDFPPRISDSTMDGLRKQAQGAGEFGGGRGSLIIHGSWGRFVADRPQDIPFYTAVNGRATIAVLISRSNVPDPDDLKRVLENSSGVSIQLSAFLEGRHPLVRASFIFPDNPSNPLILESPLNISDGDIQDFAIAAMADDAVDLVLRHQAFPEGDVIVVGCRGAGLSDVVKRAFGPVVEAYETGLTRTEFTASKRLMEQVYPSANAGVRLDLATLLAFEGEARNRIIKYVG